MKGRGRRRRNESVARPRSGSGGDDGGERPLSGYEVGSRAARARFGTREGSRGGDYSQADLLTLVAASEGRAFTPQEERYVRQSIAEAGYDPYATERVRVGLAGTDHRGRLLSHGQEISTEDRHDATHVVAEEQWPAGTSKEDYLASAREVVLDPKTRILYSRRPYPGGNRRHLGFIRQSGELRGPGGSQWMFVEYRLETGHWMTAHQRPEGPEDIEAENRREDTLWMNAPE